MNPTQAELDRHYGYVYRITLRSTGEVYYGLHRHTPGEEWMAYLGSGVRITHLVAKLGPACFDKEVVCWSEDDIDLQVRELTTILQAEIDREPLLNVASGSRDRALLEAIRRFIQPADDQALLDYLLDNHEDAMALLLIHDRAMGQKEMDAVTGWGKAMRRKSRRRERVNLDDCFDAAGNLL